MHKAWRETKDGRVNTVGLLTYIEYIILENRPNKTLLLA